MADLTILWRGQTESVDPSSVRSGLLALRGEPLHKLQELLPDLFQVYKSIVVGGAALLTILTHAVDIGEEGIDRCGLPEEKGSERTQDFEIL